MISDIFFCDSVELSKYINLHNKKLDNDEIEYDTEYNNFEEVSLKCFKDTIIELKLYNTKDLNLLKSNCNFCHIMDLSSKSTFIDFRTKYYRVARKTFMCKIILFILDKVYKYIHYDNLSNIDHIDLYININSSNNNIVNYKDNICFNNSLTHESNYIKFENIHGMFSYDNKKNTSKITYDLIYDCIEPYFDDYMTVNCIFVLLDSYGFIRIYTKDNNEIVIVNTNYKDLNKVNSINKGDNITFNNIRDECIYFLDSYKLLNDNYKYSRLAFTYYNKNKYIFYEYD